MALIVTNRCSHSWGYALGWHLCESREETQCHARLEQREGWGQQETRSRKKSELEHTTEGGPLGSGLTRLSGRREKALEGD